MPVKQSRKRSQSLPQYPVLSTEDEPWQSVWGSIEKDIKKEIKKRLGKEGLESSDVVGFIADCHQLFAVLVDDIESQAEMRYPILRMFRIGNGSQESQEKLRDTFLGCIFTNRCFILPIFPYKESTWGFKVMEVWGKDVGSRVYSR